MNEVKFIKWKNVWTKTDDIVTIWVETNERTFDILKKSYEKIIDINISYLDFKFDLKCTINDSSSSTSWNKDHWVCKLDILNWDIIPTVVFNKGKIVLTFNN